MNGKTNNLLSIVKRGNVKVFFEVAAPLFQLFWKFLKFPKPEEKESLNLNLYSMTMGKIVFIFTYKI
jgi:hypothetical protein